MSLTTRPQYINRIRQLLEFPTVHTGSRTGYFTKQEIYKVLDTIGVDKGSSYQDICANVPNWSKQWAGDACSSLDNLKLLLQLVKDALGQQKADAEREADDTRLRREPESQEFHGQEESFSVVDIGLTEGETTLDSVYKLLPAAITETASSIAITDQGDGMWDVSITFFRK